jgi:LysM repeat protein
MSHVPILIAALCVSVALLVAIYKIGVQGLGLREKVGELTQKNTQLAETLKSVEEELQQGKPEPMNEPSEPTESSSAKPRPVKKRASAKPSKVSKIMYLVKDGDSLSGISRRFGVSVEQLRSWNNMEGTDLLLAGRVLIINKTMTTDDLPYAAQDAGREKVAGMDKVGIETTAKRGKPSEIGARGEKDPIASEKALKQIAEIRAEAEAANQAIAQLQAKLDSERKKYGETMARLEEEVQRRKALEEKLATDYIPKEKASKQIAEVRAEAEAANQAIAQLQAKLDSERRVHEQTAERREEEAEERKDLEEEPSTGKPVKETVHVIREGENLFRIGISYGVPWKILLKFNDLADADAIYVGQKIRIPRVEEAEAGPTLSDER